MSKKFDITILPIPHDGDLYFEVHSPVLKHATCINQYSGILGTKTITLSPDVTLATVLSTFAALVIDKLELK